MVIVYMCPCATRGKDRERGYRLVHILVTVHVFFLPFKVVRLRKIFGFF